VLEKFVLKTAAVQSMNIILKYTLIYTPMYCAFAVLSDVSNVLCAAVIFIDRNAAIFKAPGDDHIGQNVMNQ
jgi:hypothetical protein